MAVLLASLAVPAIAGDPGRTFVADGARFTVTGEVLEVLLESPRDPVEDQMPENGQLDVSYRIEKDGSLRIDGRPVPTDRRGRQSLRDFVRVIGKLAELTERVAQDVTRQTRHADDPREIERLAKRIVRTGEEVEKQSLELERIVAELNDRVPELASLLARLQEDTQ